MEDLDLVQLLAHAHKLDGLAGDRLDGQCRAPSGVAVQLGEHHAVDVQGVVKGLGRVHRVLADHGVHHQQDLGGLHRRLDAFELIISSSSTWSRPAVSRNTRSVPCSLAWAMAALAMSTGSVWPIWNTGMSSCLPTTSSLLNGGGAVDVAGSQQRALALLAFHQAASLAQLVVLPAPWRPTIITTVGGLEAMVSLVLSPPHQVGELLV